MSDNPTFLEPEDLDELKRAFPDQTVHGDFRATIPTCSVQTRFDRCGNHPTYRVYDDMGQPTDSRVCGKCKPFVEHLLSTWKRFSGWSVQPRARALD